MFTKKDIYELMHEEISRNEEILRKGCKSNTKGNLDIIDRVIAENEHYQGRYGVWSFDDYE